MNSFYFKTYSISEQIFIRGHALIFFVTILSLLRPSFVNAIICIAIFIIYERRNIFDKRFSIIFWLLLIASLMIGFVTGLINRLDLYILQTIILTFLVIYYSKDVGIKEFISFLDILIFCYFIYGFIIVVPSILLLGIDFYPYIYDLMNQGIGSTSGLSNSMALGIIIFTMRFILKDFKKVGLYLLLIGLCFIIFGILAGGRTFQIVLIMCFIPILLRLVESDKATRNKNKIAKFFLLLSTLTFFTLLIFYILLQSRLGLEGLESQRFLVWTQVLSNYSIFELQEVGDLSTRYQISAFHNFILDSFYIYGKFAFGIIVPVFLLIFVVLYKSFQINTKKSYKIHLMNIIITSIAFLMTTVVPRGDVFQIFICITIAYLFCNIFSDKRFKKT